MYKQVTEYIQGLPNISGFEDQVALAMKNGKGREFFRKEGYGKIKTWDRGIG